MWLIVCQDAIYQSIISSYTNNYICRWCECWFCFLSLFPIPYTLYMHVINIVGLLSLLFCFCSYSLSSKHNQYPINISWPHYIYNCILTWFLNSHVARYILFKHAEYAVSCESIEVLGLELLHFWVILMLLNKGHIYKIWLEHPLYYPGLKPPF